ncbi:MAG: (d)CMP kinase, partial [Planctomycetes bacterium]|nr:(d)CMP kinase [Planctomycetota bacterium]
SRVAKRIAAARGFRSADTAALHRAVALTALRQRVTLDDPDAMLRVAESSDIAFDATGTRILLDGEDVSREIRSPEVSQNVKFAARVPAIRDQMVRRQQEMCRSRPVVMEGRDITTVVLPAARWKFFLTASPEARAGRRHAEMLAAGRDVDLGDILADINMRDASDYQVGPMKEARDRALAWNGIHYLDPSDMRPDEVVAAILDRMQ